MQLGIWYNFEVTIQFIIENCNSLAVWSGVECCGSRDWIGRRRMVVVGGMLDENRNDFCSFVDLLFCSGREKRHTKTDRGE